MSFPYFLDLSFGSEKATADSFGRVSFGASGGEGTKIPTTIDELNALVDSGKAERVYTTAKVKPNGKYTYESEENPNILGFVGLQEELISLPVNYNSENNGYDFDNPYPNAELTTHVLFVIYK